MFVHVKQACEFKGKGGEKCRLPFGFIGNIPAWVERDVLFCSMVRGGLICVHDSAKSVDNAQKDEKKKSK